MKITSYPVKIVNRIDEITRVGKINFVFNFLIALRIFYLKLIKIPNLTDSNLQFLEKTHSKIERKNFKN